MADPVPGKRQELRQAIRDCRERGLYEASKWAALQLTGLLPDPRGDSPVSRDAEDEIAAGDRDAAPDAMGSSTPPLTRAESDAHDLALAHFQMREYRSAAHVLSKAQTNRSKFLRMYATYLAGEKRRDEERTEKGSLAAYTSSNVELAALERELSRLADGGSADGFLLYLLGLVLLDKQETEAARRVLESSVTLYPCNWSAWKALQSACPDFDCAAALSLPDHFASRFFRAGVCTDMHRNAEGLAALRLLGEVMPRSQPLILAVAVAHNNLQNYDEAQELFEDLLNLDPHCLDGMDSYSNILYVKEDTSALAQLAQRCAELDRYRPECCCVVGNYYSLRGQHEKAVVYFRRALRLDPTYLPAWTLMGHEYVELKNPPAAIEAYRRAVDVNPRDYRAWYGLGQTYELVNMPHYAQYYYRRAVELRPNDARMWNAMAHCYAAQGSREAAVRCYNRALPHDKEGVAVRQLAVLHAEAGERGEAARFHRLNLDRLEAEGQLAGQDAVEALTFLAQYHREQGELQAAEEYFTRLLDYGVGQEKEEAKASLRDIREALAATPRPGGGGLRGGTVGRTPSPSPSDMGVTPPPRR